MNTIWLTEQAQDLLAAYGPHARDLGLAYVLAFIIGWNRERESNSAGLRTFPLVAIAACGFVQSAETITAGNPEATARIVEGVITGIGFIGAGAILKGGAAIRGTATAASIWATGAMGAAIALGSYDVAVMVCLFTAITLYALTPLKPRRVAEAEDSASPIR
ncbi:MgtC/SapB family protein [Roseomonas sp. F4]